MQYCIAGHHSGLPDGGFPNDTPDQSTLQGRMKRTSEDISAYEKEWILPDIEEKEFLEFLIRDCDSDRDKIIDKFAFPSRFSFSCLTDADSLDTEKFCGNFSEKQMQADFERCLKKWRIVFLPFVAKHNYKKAELFSRNKFSKRRICFRTYSERMRISCGISQPIPMKRKKT